MWQVKAVRWSDGETVTLTRHETKREAMGALGYWRRQTEVCIAWLHYAE